MNDNREAKRLLMSADNVADALGVSVRHIWNMNAGGRLPEPVKFGRSVRWRSDEIRQWVSSGCPPRHKWVYES